MQPRGPGTGWAAEVEVAPSLRAAVGAKRLRKGLGTRSGHIADARFLPALIELHARIAAAVRRHPDTDPVLIEAMALRQSVAAVRTGRLDGWAAPPAFVQHAKFGLVQEDAQDTAMGLLSESIVARADAIEAAEGAPRAHAFADIAFGRATPITHHVDDWLTQPGKRGARRSRTVLDYRHIVEVFRTWAAAEGVLSIEGVTRKIAGRYLGKLHGDGLSAARVGTVVSALTMYWKWLDMRGAVEGIENVWQRQAPPKTARAAKGDERPFTDAEVVALIAGAPDPLMLDLMRLAALTGGRIEELCRLTVGMCAGGAFDLPGSKTEAAARRIPLHPGLAALVAARSADKASSDFLLHELGKPNQHGERSAAISQRFGRYRQTVGVHERGDGQRRSAVTFHSWRRFFITKAIQAGHAEHVVAQVVGHKRRGMTLGVYFGGDTVETLRACVEAVKLPEAAVVATPEQPPVTPPAVPLPKARRGTQRRH